MVRSVYLDNNSTTPCDPRVVEVMLDVLKQHYGNASSNIYPQGWYADELVKIAREQVAALINATPEEIIFTSGATEANNLVVKGLAGHGPGSIKHFVSANTEHRSVLDPLAHLKSVGHEVTLLPVDRYGYVDASALKSSIQDNTVLLTFMLANNEIGTIHDVPTLKLAASNANAFFHTDATQACGKIPVDVKSLDVDFLSLSAHKMYGPKGVGALYIKRTIDKQKLLPLLHGGGQEFGLRPGTLNVPGIVGFGKACSIAKDNLAAESKSITALTKYFLESLKRNIPAVVLNGPELDIAIQGKQNFKRLPGNLNLSIPGVNNVRLLGMLCTKISFSLSSACQTASKTPSHVLQALGISAEAQRECIRLALGRFTTKDEVDFAVEQLTNAVQTILKN